MSLDELRRTLSALPAGQCAGIHRDLYAELFPPGEPDESAVRPAAEQPGKIGLRHELQLAWQILLRWREYRVATTCVPCNRNPSIWLERKERVKKLDLTSN
jgi:hypothetical protein